MSKPPLHIAITYQPKSMTEQKPPLWEVMYRADAYCTPASEYQEGIGPVIRAVRDWLFPLDESGDPIGYLTCAQAEDRLALRTLLTAEADRAERGEVERD